MAISRYGDAEESLGRVRILLDLDADLADRDVVLVEDIVDTGLTLPYLLSVAAARGAGLRRGLHAARQVGRGASCRSTPVRGLRLPGRVRRRVRPGLPRALPEPARHPAGRRPRGAQGRPGRPRACCDGARPPGGLGWCPTCGPLVTLDARADDRDGADRRSGGTPDEPADRAAARAQTGSATCRSGSGGRGRGDRPGAAGRRDAATDDPRPAQDDPRRPHRRRCSRSSSPSSARAPSTRSSHAIAQRRRSSRSRRARPTRSRWRSGCRSRSSRARTSSRGRRSSSPATRTKRSRSSGSSWITSAPRTSRLSERCPRSGSSAVEDAVDPRVVRLLVADARPIADVLERAGSGCWRRSRWRTSSNALLEARWSLAVIRVVSRRSRPSSATARPRGSSRPGCSCGTGKLVAGHRICCGRAASVRTSSC